MYIHDGFDIIIIICGGRRLIVHILSKKVFVRNKVSRRQKCRPNILFVFFYMYNVNLHEVTYNVGTKLKQESGGDIDYLNKKGFEAPVFNLALFFLFVYI